MGELQLQSQTDDLLSKINTALAKIAAWRPTVVTNGRGTQVPSPPVTVEHQEKPGREKLAEFDALLDRLLAKNNPMHGAEATSSLTTTLVPDSSSVPPPTVESAPGPPPSATATASPPTLLTSSTTAAVPQENSYLTLWPPAKCSRKCLSYGEAEMSITTPHPSKMDLLDIQAHQVFEVMPNTLGTSQACSTRATPPVSSLYSSASHIRGQGELMGAVSDSSMRVPPRPSDWREPAEDQAARPRPQPLSVTSMVFVDAHDTRCIDDNGRMTSDRRSYEQLTKGGGLKNMLVLTTAAALNISDSQVVSMVVLVTELHNKFVEDHLVETTADKELAVLPKPSENNYVLRPPSKPPDSRAVPGVTHPRRYDDYHAAVFLIVPVDLSRLPSTLVLHTACVRFFEYYERKKFRPNSAKSSPGESDVLKIQFLGKSRNINGSTDAMLSWWEEKISCCQLGQLCAVQFGFTSIQLFPDGVQVPGVLECMSDDISAALFCGI